MKEQDTMAATTSAPYRWCDIKKGAQGEYIAIHGWSHGTGSSAYTFTTLAKAEEWASWWINGD